MLLVAYWHDPIVSNNAQAGRVKTMANTITTALRRWRGFSGGQKKTVYLFSLIASNFPALIYVIGKAVLSDYVSYINYEFVFIYGYCSGLGSVIFLDIVSKTKYGISENDLKDSDTYLVSKDIADLEKTITHALENGNIVLIEGGYNTGKSFLLSRLFKPENIFVKKHECIHSSEISISAQQQRSASTRSVAIDETGCLSDEHKNALLARAIEGGRGIVFAIHSLDQIAGHIEHYNEANNLNVLVTRIELVKFDNDLCAPVWKIHRQ